MTNRRFLPLVPVPVPCHVLRSNAGCLPWLCPRFPASCPFRVFHITPPSQCTVRAGPFRVPLGQTPSLRRLLRSVDAPRPRSFVRPLLRYYEPVRLLGSVRVGYPISDLPRPDWAWDSPQSLPELSRFPRMELLRMPSAGEAMQRVSDSVVSVRPSLIGAHRVAFPLTAQGRHTRKWLSELNTSPA